MSNLTLKIVPMFYSGKWKVTPTDAHTTYNNKLEDFKGKQKHSLWTLWNMLALTPHTLLM